MRPGALNKYKSANCIGKQGQDPGWKNPLQH